MRKLMAIIAALAVTLVGCDSAGNAGAPVSLELSRQMAEAPRSQFLAYEHSLTIEIDHDRLAEKFDTLLSSCAMDTKYECTVMQSNLSVGDHAYAVVQMRMLPNGIAAFTTIAADGAEVTARSTHVEDLESSIMDVRSRTAMLTATRDKLLEIEDKAATDVESLIRIASELSRVQSELEQLAGRSAHQTQRVARQVLNIRLSTQGSRSFWAPIGDALSEFGDNLSSGISDAISILAYLLPWLLIVYVLLYLVRIVWRRTRSRR